MNRRGADYGPNAGNSNRYVFWRRTASFASALKMAWPRAGPQIRISAVRVPLFMLCAAIVAHSALFAADTPKDIPSREDIQHLLQRVIMPDVDFKAISLPEALDFIGAEIRRQDPRGRGVPIRLELGELF